MDIMQPIDPSTALSSFPIAKNARVSKVASNSSMSSDRSNTRASSLSISEASKPLRENSIPYERSTTYSLDEKRSEYSTQDHAVRRYKSSDLLKLESDRESVINLAKFLRMTDPPPNNYMSLPDAGQRQNQNKMLPFKMLRRQTIKRSSDSAIKTLRLPDSAVAAKTSKGHWHIAISIPVEYDHQELNTPTQNQTTKHTKTQSETAIWNGPITVLKPAIRNVRPAAMERVHMKSQSHNDLRQAFGSPRPLCVPLLPDAEDGPTLPALYDQKADEDVPPVVKGEDFQSVQSFRSDNMVTAGNIPRPESQRSDVRKSEDTAFTVQSLDSSIYHTRGQSSISTAPSISYPVSPRVVWPHKSQKSGSSPVLDQTEQPVSAQLPQSVVATRTNDSFRPTSVGSEMSSANLNIAATAQGYGPDMPGTQVVFVRKGTQTPSYRARIARRSPKNSSAEYILSSQSSVSRDYSAPSPNGVDMGGMTKVRQSRRDRVKAIRSRDMAKLRAMKKYEQVMASVTGQEIPVGPVSPPSDGQRTEQYRRQTQKRSLSYASIAEEMAWQESPNSLTPVMVVANIEPSTAASDIFIRPAMLVASLEPSTPTPKFCAPVSCHFPQDVHDMEMKMSMRHSPDEAQTPPRSLTPSPASSDTEMGQSLDPRPWTTSASSSKRCSNIGKHRSDVRRQKSMQDESIDIRMRRLETINAVIFRTLNAVVEMGVGFRELRQLLPAESAGLDEASSRKGCDRYSDEERDPVGSLIRELRGAVKIGQEELAKYGAAV